MLVKLGFQPLHSLKIDISNKRQESAGVQPGRVGPAPPGAASVCRPTRAVPSSRGDYMTMQMGCPRQSYVDTSPVAPISYADMRTGIVVEEASLPGATAAAPSASLGHLTQATGKTPGICTLSLRAWPHDSQGLLPPIRSFRKREGMSSSL